MGAAGIAGALGIEEDLPTDTKDLLTNIEGWKDDSEYMSQHTLIQNLWRNATELDLLAQSIYSQLGGSTNANELGSDLAQFASKLDAVKYSVNKLSTLFPGLLNQDFILTQGKVRDVESAFQKILELGRSSAQSTARDTPYSPDKPREPSSQELGGDDHGQAKQSPQQESERISGLQEFLKQYVDGSILVTGTMDQKTRAALDEFAEKISVELGVGNLDGTRLEREGTNASLRKIYDVYKHPWKYLE